MKENIAKILENWNVRGAIVKQVYDSAWQVEEQFILKVYDNVNMLNRNIKMLSILEDMDIPVPRLIRTKTDVSYVNEGKYYYILTEKLKGNNIVQLHDVPDIGNKMGSIIARLHKAFKECENQDEFWNNSLLREMEGWIRDSFVENEWKLIEKERFESTLSELKKVYCDLPVGLIHRDVHFGNFLFQDGEFSGYIDFDLSQSNVRLFDLCYFMLGLLSEEEKMDITVDEWFIMLGEVFLGYDQIIKLSEKEITAVPFVMESIELLCSAWFINQKDMSCAKDAIRIYDFIYNNRYKIIKKLQSRVEKY